MQVPISNTANAVTVLSDAAPVAGIKITGLAPGGCLALYLGNRNTGGWGRYVRFHGELQQEPIERLFLEGDEQQNLSSKGSGDDVIVLVRTGNDVKNTSVTEHGIYVPRDSDAKQIERGTTKRSGTVTSREELWLLSEGASIIVLTATGQKVRITNEDGKVFESSVDMGELEGLVTGRVLDIIEQTIDQNINKGLHWLIGHASRYPEAFSHDLRKQFRSIVAKYRDKASEGVVKRLEGLYRHFSDGRFNEPDNAAGSRAKSRPTRKGLTPAMKAKKAARAAKDRERTFATKGKSPQPPQTHKKPKVKAQA